MCAKQVKQAPKEVPTTEAAPDPHAQVVADGLGIDHGVDLEAIARAGREICTALGREPASKVAQALKAKAA